MQDSGEESEWNPADDERTKEDCDHGSEGSTVHNWIGGVGP